MHGRPVICSDIGGMSEKVTHGVNGLQFGVGSTTQLADTITAAVSTPALWERLREGIPRIYAMDEHVASLENLYNELLERAAGDVETAAAARHVA